jgi:hypothetical protein
MSSAVSIAGASAVESSLQGLHRSSARLQSSAETVLSASVGALNETSNSAGDTVTISDAALKLRGEASLEQGLIDGKMAGLVYTANAKVVQGANEVTGTLLEIVA